MSAIESVRRWVRFRRSILLLVGLLCLLILVPLLLVILNSFNLSRPGRAAEYGVANWLSAVDDPRMLEAVLNTVRLSAAETSIGVIAGSILAWLLARTNMPGRRPIEVGFTLAFFIPPLPLTLGWIGLLDPLYGVVNEWARLTPLFRSLTEGPANIYGFWGIVTVQSTAMVIPFMVIFLAPAYRNLGSSLEEAARMSGAGRLKTALFITRPLMMPAVLGASMVTLLRTLQAFEVELLLGAPVGLDVYSTQIYRWIRFEPPEFGKATALGAGFMVIMVGLAVIYRRVLRGRDVTTVSARARSINPVDLGRGGRWVACLGCVIFLLLTVGAPLAYMTVGSFMRRYGWFTLADTYTIGHWQQLLGDAAFVDATLNTVVLALATGIVGIGIYWWVAHVALRSAGRGSAMVDLMAWMPLAVPGILLGLGLLWLYLGTPLRVLVYGSIAGLVAAIVVGHMPTGVQQIKAGLLQVDESLDEAAAICGAGRLRRARDVMFPLLSSTLGAAMLLTFASAVRDISTIVLIAGRETRPLSILMLEYSFAGDMERAAGLGVVITALMCVFVLLIGRLGRREIRQAPRPMERRQSR